MFTSQMLIALLPLLVVSTTSIVVMLAIAFKRSHTLSATLTLTGLGLALLTVLVAAAAGDHPLITDLLLMDGISNFYTALVLVAALACAAFSYAYFENSPVNRDEMYVLLLLSVVGAIVLVSSHHAAALFLGLEIMSVPLYGMTAYIFTRKQSLEAGLKYLVLSATASASLLFGLALLYAQVGSLSFDALGHHLISNSQDPVSLVGLGLVLVAIAFKLALPPFHFWSPDIYEGASAPAGAFIGTVAKIAVFVVLWRLMRAVPLLHGTLMANVLACLAIAAILVGNLLALMQNNIKRLLGYSSIAHFGYLLIVLTIVSAVPLAQEDVSTYEVIGVYLVTYVLATLAAFGVITIMSNSQTERDVDGLEDYRGLFWAHPYPAIVLTICMLSLAGIPITAGFIGKLYVVAIGVQAHLWPQLGALVIGSTIGIFYYLRVTLNLYSSEQGTALLPTMSTWHYQTIGMVLLVIAALVLALGIYPQPMLMWLQTQAI